MSDANQKNSPQNQAIHEYLQSLLLEVPEENNVIEHSSEIEVTNEIIKKDVKSQVNQPYKEPEKKVEEKSKSAVMGLDQLVAEIPEIITDVKTEVVKQVKTATKVEAPAQQKTVSNIPDWAQTRFQCLMFNVSGLKLAVPLVKLNSVIPWDEKITETPNKTDWYLGLVQHLQSQVKVIDTALLVMPENRHELIKNDAANRLSHILLVDDFKWGLACSSIGDVIWLEKDEVKWRKNKTSRAWLSGTSLEHLCAIMDTEVFAQMLTETA